MAKTKYNWNEVIPFFDGSLTIEEIASKFNININAVKSFYYVNKEALELDFRRCVPSSPTKDTIIMMLHNGESIEEIIGDTGFSPEYVRLVAKEAKYFKPRSYDKPFTTKEVQFLIENHNKMSKKDLAKSVNKKYRSLVQKLYMLRKAGKISE